MSKLYRNQIGAAPLLILVGIMGLIVFLAISSYLPFKNSLFSLLFPKSSSYASSANLLLNPSFETLSGNWATNWQSKPNFSIDTTQFHEGTNSIKMVNTSGSATSVYTFQKIKLLPNKNYTLSVYAKSGSIASGKAIKARFVTVSPSGIYNTSSVTGATGNWTLLTTTFTTPANYVPSDSDRVDILADLNPGNIGWVDEISLVDNTAPTPTPSIQPSPSSNYTPFSLPDPDLNSTTLDVETWWNNHPLNSQSPNYNPVVSSPPNQIDVLTQFGGDIQAAINSLDPVAGGTLLLTPKPNNAVYDNFVITGKKNIHFIGQNVGGVLPILRRGEIYGCEEAKTVQSFQVGIDNRTPANMDCFTNPKTNFYFKDLVFDGGYPQLSAINAAMYAIKMRSIKNVLFDNVTVRNYLDYNDAKAILSSTDYTAKVGDDPAIHYGIIWGNGGTNNTWCRQCRFEGKQRFGFFLDGARGSGVIDSWFDQSKLGSGGLLYLTNDDFTFDLNNDGVFDNSDKRNSQYDVVVNNTFTGSSNGNSVSIMGREILIKGNNGQSTNNPYFANFSVKCSGKLARTKGVIYENFGDRIIGNIVNSSNTFSKWQAIDGVLAGGCVSATNPDIDPSLYSKLGKFILKDNTVKKELTTNGVPFTWSKFVETGTANGTTYNNPVSTPNTLQNNCSGPSC